MTNVDAFGHRFEPKIDMDEPDTEERLSEAGIQDVQGFRKALRKEKRWLENFFEFCCAEMSFTTLRMITRQDLEVLGNGYWEVLRNGEGKLAQFVYVPAFTVRLMPLCKEFVDVNERVCEEDLKFETVQLRRRFRKYVQIVDSKAVYFKELGDPRIISRRTGSVCKSIEHLKRLDSEDEPATELLHFRIHSPRCPYGVPRWIGNLLAVMGTRQAEEVNFLYFENKSVPPLAILVSGGRLSQESIPRLETFVEQNIRGKRNFHKILILEAEPPGESKDVQHTGRLRIELKPLTDAQQKDALFMRYDERNFDKVGQSFRLPPFLRGDIRDLNRATAFASLAFAEVQVFEPIREDFDFIMNRKILTDLEAQYHQFKSNAPVNRDPATTAEIIRNLSNANALPFNKAQELLEEVFNRPFPRSKESWAKKPLPLALAGIGDELEKQDLTTAELGTLGGLLRPAQGRRRRRDEEEEDLARAAERILRLRDELRKREGEEAEKEFIKVPYDEMRSWFADA